MQKLVSIGVPTGNPATSLPPVMQSSIANSSATRIGELELVEIGVVHLVSFDGIEQGVGDVGPHRTVLLTEVLRAGTATVTG
jgi:hypothetical protein